jgi:hypothetical protein
VVKINAFYSKIKSNKYVALFLILFLIDVFFILIGSLIVNFFDSSLIETEFNTANFSLLEIFFTTVLIGPILETFIFQFLIIEILFKLNIKNNYLIYILLIIFPGILYSTYYLFLKIENQKTPFLNIFLLHSLSNFVSFILDDVLQLWLFF